jgi:hypothetical protein
MFRCRPSQPPSRPRVFTHSVVRLSPYKGPLSACNNQRSNPSLALLFTFKKPSSTPATTTVLQDYLEILQTSCASSPPFQCSLTPPHPSTNSNMLLTAHITAFFGLLHLLTLANAWTIGMFGGSKCDGSWKGKNGADTTCLTQGGNSWKIYQNQEGCDFQSWSGDDCRGSSTGQYQDEKCRQVPFGSISVDCNALGGKA